MGRACQSILWKRNFEILYLLWDRLRIIGHRGWRGGSVSRILTALAKNERESSSQHPGGADVNSLPGPPAPEDLMPFSGPCKHTW